MDTMHGLREHAGHTQVSLDAWELENGCSPRDPALIAKHNELLEQNAESKRWLASAEAELTGMQNFTPKLSPRTKTTKRKATN